MTTEIMSVSPKDSSNNIVPGNVDVPDSFVKFDQQIILTKDQFELLNIIAKTHDKSVSEYVQKAALNL